MLFIHFLYNFIINTISFHTIYTIVSLIITMGIIKNLLTMGHLMPESQNTIHTITDEDAMESPDCSLAVRRALGTLNLIQTQSALSTLGSTRSLRHYTDGK